MDRWRVECLDALSSFLGRGAAPKYVNEGGISVLNQKCIRNNRVSYEQARRTDLTQRAITHERILNPLDILVNSTGVGTLGRVAQIIDIPQQTTVDSHITIVRPDSGVIDPLFLGFALRWLEPNIEAMAEGSTGQTELSRTRLGKLKVAVPGWKEQGAIAGVLGALDDKIDLNRCMNETLEAMARVIFKDWFVDFGPTRAKMGGRKPYLAQEIWDLFPDKLDNEGKPEGWEMGVLADIAEMNAKSWSARNHPDEVKYVDLSNTKWGVIETTAKLAWEKAPSRARRTARIGDTIVATTRPGNGSFAYISRDGYTVSTGFAVLTPKEQVYRDLVYITATNPENIERLANLADGHGGAYPAVKPSEVSDTEVVLPSKEMAEAFAATASAIRNKIEFAKQESRTLAQTRDLLLPKLMSGEIRVQEAEESTEGAT